MEVKLVKVPVCEPVFISKETYEEYSLLKPVFLNAVVTGIVKTLGENTYDSDDIRKALEKTTLGWEDKYMAEMEVAVDGTHTLKMTKTDDGLIFEYFCISFKYDNGAAE